MPSYMRIWQAVDVDGVMKHLMIVGELMADCASCRELGIKWAEARSCPQCKTEFRFITARGATGGLKISGAAVRRVKERRSDLTFVDYDDYKSITGKQSARDFFG